MVRGTGFEPADVPCKLKGSGDTDSPYYSPRAGDDPELAHLVASWATLPHPLKAAVLAIVGSHERNA